MANELFKTTVTSDLGCECEISTRDFTMVIDEPTSSDGTNQGMNPVEALLNALGACQAITARSFAKSHAIILRRLRIEVTGALDPDGFKGLNPDAKKGFSTITSTFYIDADNTEEEVNDYVDFINSICPVHDTLENAPVMESKIMTYVK